jgi:hypothetical protein
MTGHIVDLLTVIAAELGLGLGIVIGAAVEGRLRARRDREAARAKLLRDFAPPGSRDD